MLHVGQTERFLKRVEKELSFEQHRELPRIYAAVAENPWSGNSVRPAWFREVRLREKRLYYVVGEESVLFVAVSDKNQQQRIIDTHRALLEEYKNLLRELNGTNGRGQF